eukprot:3922643-Rhodomonas_salina.3
MSVRGPELVLGSAKQSHASALDGPDGSASACGRVGRACTHHCRSSLQTSSASAAAFTVLLSFCNCLVTPWVLRSRLWSRDSVVTWGHVISGSPSLALFWV